MQADHSSSSSIEPIDTEEETSPEDQEALTDLIGELIGEASGTDSISYEKILKTAYTRHTLVPIASDNAALSYRECKKRLKKVKVKTSVPKFATPLVSKPLLLDSPIFGVDIVPRWPKAKRKNEVADCRLLLALVDVAGRAKALGVKKIEYYSIHRPLNPPPKKCSKGKRGRKCRKRLQKYKKTIKGKLSQHRRALAIDIRWLTLEDDTVLDVLEHYDRRDGVPPCSYEASDPSALLLQEFACGLHQDKVFNVVLTPNANKAHHNHFHFDITQGVTWHIAK